LCYERHYTYLISHDIDEEDGCAPLQYETI